MEPLLDESFDIDLEPNHRLRTIRPRERLLAAVAGGQDRAGAVCAAPQLSEAVPGAPVDPDPADAVQRERLLDAGDLAQLAGRRHEEANAGAPDFGDRRERRLLNLLAARTPHPDAL